MFFSGGLESLIKQGFYAAQNSLCGTVLVWGRVFDPSRRAGDSPQAAEKVETLTSVAIKTKVLIAALKALRQPCKSIFGLPTGSFSASVEHSY
jgi:hypothetical protein